VALHQVGRVDGVALVKPVLFLLGQRALQKVTWAMKAQDGQAPLLGARTRWREVVEQELFAQHGVHRFCQGGALARAQAAVVAKKAGHHGVGRVFKREGQPHQLGTGVKKNFGMHPPIVPLWL